MLELEAVYWSLLWALGVPWPLRFRGELDTQLNSFCPSLCKVGATVHGTACKSHGRRHAATPQWFCSVQPSTENLWLGIGDTTALYRDKMAHNSRCLGIIQVVEVLPLYISSEPQVSATALT